MRRVTTYQPVNAQPGSPVKVTTQTSWGSLFAAIGAVAGAITPFLPPQYQLAAGAVSAVVGVVATKLP